MKLTYLSHGALQIVHEGFTIVTDPWLAGPAYSNQWYQFPKPYLPPNLANTDMILYSHGHEDHLHFPTLDLFQPKVKIWYPYSWFGSAKKTFASVGFPNATEAINQKRYALGPGIFGTWFANNLDNIILLEIGGKKILNLNDALVSAPPAIMQHLLEKLKPTCGKIDYLLTSYGGAAFFPNCYSAPGKNDKEVAFLKEMYILNNTCQAIAALQPENVIFFASDYVLLHPQQQWMNDIKISRQEAADYYATYCREQQLPNAVNFIELYPGDSVDKDQVHLMSPYHEMLRAQSRNELVQQLYTAEIIALSALPSVSTSKIAAFKPVLSNFIGKKKMQIPGGLHHKLKFDIKIEDAESITYLHINAVQPDAVSIHHSPNPASILEIAIQFNRLQHAIEQEWGGDTIVIGYGCQVTLTDTSILAEQLDVLCIQLICNYPSSKAYFLKNPVRSLRYLFHDPLKQKVIWNKRAGNAKLSFDNLVLNDSSIWLTRNKCEICNACNLPSISEIDNYLQKRVQPL